jgi:hypothetical protein
VSFVNFYILQDIRDENGNLQRQAWVDAQVRFDYWTASGPRPEDPTVPAVPLPAAGWLLLAGVAGLDTVSKRRRKQH